MTEEVEEVEDDKEDDSDEAGAVSLTNEDLDKEPEDYVEENTTKDGQHIRKEVH